jgi:hypothetical protein
MTTTEEFKHRVEKTAAEPPICAIVGVEEAKSLHEVAHCIANMYAYGLAQTFQDNVEQIALAIRKAKDLPDPVKP